MGLKIVTGRTGTPHVTSNQIQAFNRSLLGDLAILDVGQHFDAVVRDANTIRIYDGCIVVQGIYAVIPHDEYEDVLVEPVSVGNTRIDTIYLHYAKDMETDTETVEIDIAQGEEAINNPVKPDIDAGGDTWEGTTDIRIPLYDVTVTSFETTITAYEYMDVYSPNISDLNQRIPETTVSGVKGNAESEYRSGNVNITPTNIGLGNVDNTADTDKPVSTAQQSALDEKVDKVTGKGLSTNDYTDAEKQKLANIESNAQANVQSDWNEDDTEDDGYIKNKPNLSTSLTATGNPLIIESAEANLVECTAEVEAEQDLHGYDHPWVGGAGKNKLPMTVDGIKAANTSGTWVGNTYTHANVAFTILTDSDDNVIGFNINGTANNTALLFLGPSVQESENIILNGGISNDIPIVSRYTTEPYDWRSSVGGDISAEMSRPRVFFIQVNNGVAVSNQKCYPMARLASISDSTFEPYTNISPIIGQTEVVIDDVGKNLFDEQTYPFTDGKYIYGATGGDDSSGVLKATLDYIPCDKYAGKTVTLNARPQGETPGIAFYDSNKTFVSGIKNNNSTSPSWTFTIPSDAKYMRFCVTSSATNVQIEKGNTPTPYEPYKGKTYRVEIGQKNKLPMTVDGIKAANGGASTWNGNSKTIGGVAFTILTDSDNNVIGIRCNGQASDSIRFYIFSGSVTVSSGSKFNLNASKNANNYDAHVANDSSDIAYIVGTSAQTAEITLSDTTFTRVFFYFNSDYNDDITIYPMIRLATETDSTFAPYNPNLPDAIYGSELDVLTGKMVVTHGYIESYNSEPLPSTWISDRDEYSEGATPTIGAQVVYELATPFTIQLTPQQIRLLKGTNNISCNTGDLSIKYYPDNVLGQLKGDIEKGLNAYYDYQIQALWDKIAELQA